MKKIFLLLIPLLVLTHQVNATDITYADKSTGDSFTAANANEIKTAVNTKQDISSNWPTVAGIAYWTSGTSWGGAYTLVTTVGSAGSDTSIPSEQAVREAFSSIAFNMGGALSNLLFDTGENFLDDTETDTDHVFSASKVISLDAANRSKDIVVEDPDAADEWIIFKATSAMTISDIHCIATGGTSVVIDVNECASDGTTCTSVDAEITCDTDGAEDDGTFTNGAIDAGDWVQLEINTVTGTVTSLNVSVFY